MWCPGCRTEYVEGIKVCVDCGTQLVQEVPPEPKVHASIPTPLPSEKWAPKHVWQFFTFIVLWNIFAYALFPFIIPKASVVLNPGKYLTIKVYSLILYQLIILGIVLIIARVTRPCDFFRLFALSRFSEAQVLFSIILSVVLLLSEAYLTYGSLHLDIAGRVQAIEIGHFIGSIILAPFIEETAFRGFAYRALRNFYPVTQSILIVAIMYTFIHPARWSLLIRSVLHMDVKVHTVIPFAGIVISSVIACVLLERSRSLWNCIAFHWAGNAMLQLL